MLRENVEKDWRFPLFIFGRYSGTNRVDLNNSFEDVVIDISEKDAEYVVNMSEILIEALVYIADRNIYKYEQLLSRWRLKNVTKI